MATLSSPSDQRAGVRQISFALENAGILSAPVTLVIRPEDLTRTEPTRVSVNQTMGREISGWADYFGRGLPSVTIAGHTGWRRAARGGNDGMASFEQLNNLVQHQYADAKQEAIEKGIDPAEVKLLFIDELDNFAWSVTPTTFVLRRSRTRPLLFQYHISLQAISTTIDEPSKDAPFMGSVSGGLAALEAVVGKIEQLSAGIVGVVNEVVGFITDGISVVAVVVGDFTRLANRTINAAHSVIESVLGGANIIASDVINIASDLSSVGTNLFRTMSAAQNLPASLRAELARTASAYNEVACIFRNSLRPKRVYEDYEGLYGSSNCSSTTGGRPVSPYTNANPFTLMRPAESPVQVSSSALASISAMKGADPVLAPMRMPEIVQHVTEINNGIALVDLTL